MARVNRKMPWLSLHGIPSIGAVVYIRRSSSDVYYVGSCGALVYRYRLDEMMKYDLMGWSCPGDRDERRMWEQALINLCGDLGIQLVNRNRATKEKVTPSRLPQDVIDYCVRLAARS